MTGATRVGIAITLGLAVMTTTACASQIDALAPVGGGEVTALRIASIDALQDLGIAMMRVPVCVAAAESSDGYTCEGTTAAGEPISVTSPGTSPLSLAIAIDGKRVFEGTVADVIDKAAGRGE